MHDQRLLALLKNAVARPDLVFGDEQSWLFAKREGAGWTIAKVEKTARAHPDAEITDFQFGVDDVDGFGDPSWVSPNYAQ